MDIRTLSGTVFNGLSFDWGIAKGEAVSRPVHDASNPCAGIQSRFETVSNVGLAVERGLHTAVLISLFSDRRAETDSDIDPASNPRGWCGEAHVLEPSERWGSHFWLGYTTKTADEWLGFMRFAAEEALAWLVKKGFVERMSVTAEWEGERLKLKIDLFQNARDLHPIYNAVWSLTFDQNPDNKVLKP